MEGQKITVVIRKRPLGKKELAKGDQDIVQVRDTATVILTEIKQKVDLTKFVEEHNFNFDLAFSEQVNNEQLYMTAVRPIIEAAFNRAKVTCFAYGQTGSGKTYTMLGDQDSQVPGLYVLASYDIFQMLQRQEYAHLVPTISFYEIYCGKLFDLLNDRTPLTALEDNKGNVQIKGLCEKKVTNVQQLMQIISYGQSTRTTASNSANSESSRSHALLQINLKQGKHVWGKLSFIDLAGSERGADVQDQNKQTRVDGAEINKSLLALKECIRALDQNKNHTPFRGSKLTLVLKDSFTGNCRTVMIGNISPSNASSEHTLNTLRYADRVKELKKPKEEKQQMDQLTRELGLARGHNNVVRKAYRNPDSESDEEDQSANLPKTQSQQAPPYQTPQQQIPRTMSQQNTKAQQYDQYQQPINYNQAQLFPQTNLSQYIQQPQTQQQPQPQSQPNLSSQHHTKQTKAQAAQAAQQQMFQGINMPPIGGPQQSQSQQPASSQSLKAQLQQPQQSTQVQQQQYQNPSQQYQPQTQPQQFLNQNQQQGLQQQNYQQPKPQLQQPLPRQQNYNPQVYQQQAQQYQLQYSSVQNPIQAPQQFQNNLQPGVLNGAANGYIFNQEPEEEELFSDANLLTLDPERELEIQKIYNSHQELVQTILQEEDEIILMHREHIDQVVETCKKDMRLLNQIESNSMHIQDYIREVREQLIEKQQGLESFIQKINEYELLLDKEKELSEEYYDLKKKKDSEDVQYINE